MFPYQHVLRPVILDVLLTQFSRCASSVGNTFKNTGRFSSFFSHCDPEDTGVPFVQPIFNTPMEEPLALLVFTVQQFVNFYLLVSVRIDSQRRCLLVDRRSNEDDDSSSSTTSNLTLSQQKRQTHRRVGRTQVLSFSSRNDLQFPIFVLTPLWFLFRFERTFPNEWRVSFAELPRLTWKKTLASQRYPTFRKRMG